MVFVRKENGAVTADATITSTSQYSGRTAQIAAPMIAARGSGRAVARGRSVTVSPPRWDARPS
jgi:phosphohistidine swiveling domain-containing protein